MASKSPRTPKDLKLRRPRLQPGDVVMIPATIQKLRTLKPADSAVAHDVVTIRIPGSPTPVTIRADYLLGEPTDA